jgi:hypothetical protein
MKVFSDAVCCPLDCYAPSPIKNGTYAVIRADIARLMLVAMATRVNGSGPNDNTLRTEPRDACTSACLSALSTMSFNGHG